MLKNFFKNGPDRTVIISAISDFLRQHRGTVVIWGMYLFLSVAFLLRAKEPSQPTVKILFDDMQTLGFLAVVLLSIVVFTRKWWQHENRNENVKKVVFDSVTHFIGGIFIYAFSLFIIGIAGDDCYRWAAANPRETVIGFASLLVVGLIIGIGHVILRKLEDYAHDSNAPCIAAAGVAVLRPKATTLDEMYTAAHEAGHALVCAARRDIPADVRLTTKDTLDYSGSLGALANACNSPTVFLEQRFAEWQMLLFLAGKIAEARIMGGKTTLGSGRDNAQWLNLAQLYLANHYNGIYYVYPANPLEQQQNEAKLEALQKEQTGILNRFFDLNGQVLIELADALREKRTMGRDDLVPFLRKVQLTPEFPLPFGSFSMFAENWPEEDRSRKSEDSL